MIRRLCLALTMAGFLIGSVPLGSADEPATKAAKKEKVKEKKKDPDVVYVPTPNDVVAKMLEMAKVTKDDVVYDLGCGDGRIVVTAAKKFGAKGIGFDINPVRIKESLANIKKNKVEALVEIKDEDIFEVDLSKASVITLYLLPGLNTKLVPQFNKMKPGSRVVSHAYEIIGAKPDQVERMTSKEDGGEHVIYLWTVPIEPKEDEEEK